MFEKIEKIKNTYLFYFMTTTVPAIFVLFWLFSNYSWSIVSTITYIIGYLTVYMFGMNIYYHRYWCHKHFTSNELVCKFFSVAGLLTMLGTPAYYALVHKYHHAYTDTDKDPHSPTHGRWHATFGWMFNTHKSKMSPVMIKELFKEDNVWVFELEKIKIPIVWVIPGIIIFISPAAGMGLLCAMFTSYFMEIWLNGFMHNPKTKEPINAPSIFAWLTAGSLLHKLHHQIPHRTPKEDPAYYLVKMLNVKT
jgi:fatty-acid desaturase